MQDKSAIAPVPPQTNLPEPELEAPLWLSKGMNFFRLGLGVFLLLSSLVGLLGCSVTAATPWKLATEVFSTQEISTIFRDNTNFETPTQEQIRQVEAYPLAENVAVVDFNTSDLCGALGCLYTIYRKTDQGISQLYNAYLNPNLPRGFSLFEVSDQTLNGLPCFRLHQLEDNDLKQYTVCFDGSEYTETSRISVPIPSN